jgi:WD40 repeat protein
MVCTRDGRYAYIGCNDGLIRQWDLENGKEIARFKDHRGCIYDVALTRDEKLLASGGKDGIVRIWDAMSGEPIFRCSGHTDTINEVVFAQSGKWLASASDDGSVRAWSVKDGTELRNFRKVDAQGRNWNVHSIAISPDSRWIVSGGPEKVVRVWNLETAQQAATYEIHKQFQDRDPRGDSGYKCVMENGMQFSPAGDRVISVGESDQTLRIWSRANGKEFHRFDLGFYPWRFSLSEDGRRVLMAGQDGVVHLWALPQFGSEMRVER